MLAGAFVENRNFSRAEPLYFVIRDVRQRTGGPTSKLMSAISADLGDLYVRKGNLQAAEGSYRKSVLITHKGTGRAMTGLATVLREEHRLDESESYYRQALALRSELFGTSSKQYHDTLRGYQKLMQLKRAASAS